MTETEGKTRQLSAATGLAIVEVLAAHPAGLGVSDIARSVGFDVGQTHRILRALGANGWVDQVSPSGGYRLTGKILAVAGVVLAGLDMRGAALPVMEALHAETGETIHLAERRGDQLVCVARILSVQSVMVTSQIGDTWPLAGTALGAAVRFAHAGDARPRFALDPEARRAAAAGFSVDRGRYRRDIHAVAAPIMNVERVAIGALAVSGPASRLDRERLVAFGRLVRRAAARVSHALGYPVSNESQGAVGPSPGAEEPRKHGRRR